jgi:hypothetical protein
MQTFEFLNGVHQALDEATRQESNQERRRLLEVLRSEAWARLRSTSKAPPLLFALHPGYVWVGPASSPRTFLCPQLEGIRDAWTILMNWSASRYAVHAEDLNGSPSGNALNGRLKTAIAWVEDVGCCRDLGYVLRQISVSRDGSITPPRVDFDVTLHL